MDHSRTELRGSNAIQVASMVEALEKAKEACAAGEVPVGCALYSSEGRKLAVGSNRTIADNDPTAHAEIVCMRKAAQAVGNHRLVGCHLYVTLEPCAMCVGAMLHARIARLVYGASDPKTGACGGVVDLTLEKRLNHHMEVLGGVLEAECGELLREFFKERR